MSDWQCVWKLSAPQEILTEAVFAESPDLTHEQARDLVNRIYRSNPRLNPTKSRPFGMLARGEEDLDCLRWVFSRSASAAGENFQQSSAHTTHECFISKPGAINLDDPLLTLKIPVQTFLALRSHQVCDNTDSVEVKNIQLLLKAKFPQRHICIRRET